MYNHKIKHDEKKADSNNIRQKEFSSQSRFLQKAISRPGNLSNESLLQLRGIIGNQKAGHFFKQQNQNKTIQKKENKTGIPDKLISGIKNISCYSMNDIKEHYNSDKPDWVQTHAYSQSTDVPVAMMNISSADIPLQLMKFDRFQGFSRIYNWFQNPQEDELINQEKRMKEFLETMKPYEDTPAGAQIPALRARFNEIEGSTISSHEYPDTLQSLKDIFYQLDNISSRITKKVMDYERDNDGETERWIENDQGGPKASHMIYLIQETYSLLPAVLCTDENKAVIKDAILGDLRIYPFRNSDITQRNLDFAKKRVSLLRKNFKKMINRISGDWGQISHDLGLNGVLRFIHLTGSDFHNDGQSVCILESSGGEKAVYKPRSLNPDVYLEGHQDSVHTYLNMGLGTARFTEKTDVHGDQYGYMNYLQKVRQLTNEQARQYYRKMGSMVVSTKLLGVTDLHQENILTGTDGLPVIIDAETSFLPDIMMSEAWNATLIRDTLTQFTKEGKLTPNYFYTEAELLQWQHDHPDDITPDAGFITNARQASYRPGGTYREDFRAGIQDALIYVTNHEHQIVEYLQEKVNHIFHVRIVPLATDEFNGAMASYYRDPQHNVTRITDLVQTIITSLEHNNYIMEGNSAAIIKKGVIEDFENTDIPIFRYEPSDDHIYFHGQIIATHNTGIQGAIAANVHRISHATVLQVTASID